MFEPVVSFDEALDGPIPTKPLDISAAMKVPEPAPFISVTAGSAMIAIFGMYRLNYARKPRKRRHAELRALTSVW